MANILSIIGSGDDQGPLGRQGTASNRTPVAAPPGHRGGGNGDDAIAAA